MASPWEQHVEVFLDASAGAERHAAALRGVTDALSSSNKMMLDLVRVLGALERRASLLLTSRPSSRRRIALPARGPALGGWASCRIG